MRGQTTSAATFPSSLVTFSLIWAVTEDAADTTQLLSLLEQERRPKIRVVVAVSLNSFLSGGLKRLLVNRSERRNGADFLRFQLFRLFGLAIAVPVTSGQKVEMRFAHFKINHRFERMRLRGLTGARDEFHLAAIVQNLKTLASYVWRPPPDKQAAACVT